MNKDKIKNILLVMIVAVISSALTSFLTTNSLSTNKLLGSVSYSDYLDSSKVTYSDSNVQDSIDELYIKATDYTEIRNMIYPVGSVYISVTDDTVAKVQARFGGEWESFGKGKTLVGVDSSDSNYNLIEKTGGAKTKTLTVANIPEHNHTYEKANENTGSTKLTIDQIPSHTHQLKYSYDNTSTYSGGTNSFALSSRSGTSYTSASGANVLATGGNKGHTHTVSTTETSTGKTGSGTSFSILNPYITVYMYKRIK